MFEIIDLGGMKTTTTKSAANHVYLVDVSGSMSYDLPKIRQQLKNIISVVAQPQDTFTLIWFSGKGQCGVVFESVPVTDIATVQMLHQAIDKWIKPIGLTGFVDPINLSMTIAYDKTKVNNFVMLTDGYDNTSKRDEILKRTAELQSVFQGVTFIEYGYYADRELLAKMADEVGGVHIFAEGYKEYEAAFSGAISGTVRVNNISVDVNKKAKHCIFIYGQQIRIVPVVDGKVTVPEDTQKIHSIVPKDVLSKQLSEEHLYLILYYAAKTDNTDLVWKCLEALGDVALIEMYTNAFTKQELSIFESAVESAVLDETKRYVSGKDLTSVPNKNTPTVLQLLALLADADASLVTSSEYWDYNKTSRERVAEESLPKFVPSALDTNVPLKGLVLNSSRPNVSIQTTRKGNVVLPENDFGLSSVPSFITRNYTIIRDGIKNVKSIPVIMSESEFSSVSHFTHTIIEIGAGKVYAVFDISKMPVVTRSAVENVELDAVVDTISEIKVLEISNKVLKWHFENIEAKNTKISGLVQQYGEDAAKWLSSIGVRDYGFSPVGTKSAEVSDEYEAIEVDYKIAGMSSIPSISSVVAKATEIQDAEKAGKPSKKSLNMVERLVYNAVQDLCQYSEEHLQQVLRANIQRKREMERQLAGYVFALILGRKWFGDEDEFSTEISILDEKAKITLFKTRKSVKI